MYAEASPLYELLGQDAAVRLSILLPAYISFNLN
jgi:hypothetical protein